MSSRLAGQRVCLFGRYSRGAARNRSLVECLTRAGAECVEIHDARALPIRFGPLLRRSARTPCDLILVGFRAHSDIFLARVVSWIKGVPLVFDPLISRYDERVNDRRLVGLANPLAWWYYWTDRLGCALADRVLIDTDTHLNHLVDVFGLRRTKVRRFRIGANDGLVYPPSPSAARRQFSVLFCGSYGPLHGVEQIVRAAALLEEQGDAVRFVLIGRGQTYDAVRRLAATLPSASITFLPPTPYDRVRALMADADICLGVFGTTAKTSWVVPYKVVDALAAARPVLTGDTPAIREVLTHGRDAWLCPTGDSAALADAIAQLKRNPELRCSIATRGHEAYRRWFAPDALSADLGAALADLL